MPKLDGLPRLGEPRGLDGRGRGRIWLGIDPGASGGMAALGSDGSLRLQPLGGMTLKDVWDWLSVFTPGPVADCFAAVEKVGGYVKGGGGNIGSAMFNFGRGCGELLMGLTAAGVPFDEVTPAVWQRAVGLSPRKKDETKGRWKNRLKSRAQQLFPSAYITLAVADSLLIAEYCRRKCLGVGALPKET